MSKLDTAIVIAVLVAIVLILMGLATVVRVVLTVLR